ncbi:MAG: hypothetical protein H6722_11790 [Sandaracinus sp.]|nr:hypothetical protein [Sandaracinus sp.]MCB9613126.1 hypothetical protein [Sandaracinus sp.]
MKSGSLSRWTRWCAWVLIGCASTSPTPAGTSCVVDGDCVGGVCADGVLGRVCTNACDQGCVPGWRCETASQLCVCHVAWPESWNGRDDDCDGRVDEGGVAYVPPPGEGCGRTRDCFRVEPDGVRALDLVLVVDDSNSMHAPQTALQAALPDFVDALATGDLDRDGVAEVAPLNLHVGVIRTDMGVDVPVPTCDTGLGGDGVFVSSVACGASGLRTTDEHGERLASEVACLAGVGTEGCGFVQPLEATLKAVTADGQTLAPDSDTLGHDGGANGDFRRRGAVLAIVFITDGDDCSAEDRTLFDPRSTTFTASLNLRCATYEEALHPLRRYVEGLLRYALVPSRLVIAGVVGIPEDATPTGEIDWQALLDHPAMQNVVEGERLRFSCERHDEEGLVSWAQPPRRLVRAFRDFEREGALVTLGSVCGADLAPTMDATLARVHEAVDPCFATMPPRDAEGLLRCRLVETIPEGFVCEELPGRSFAGWVGTTAGLAISCVVPQLRAGEVGRDGWYFVPNDPSCPPERPNRVRMTVPVEGASAVLECER